MFGTGGGGFKSLQVVLGANNRDLKGTLLESSRAVQSFQRDVERTNRGVATSGNLLKAGLAAGAMAAGAGLAYAAVKAAEFDKSMRNVNSLAGLSETALDKLEGKLISMSTRLPQSANTLAEGLYDVTSSGFTGADAMKVLEASATAASAGLTTTEVAAKAIAATLNAYGLQAKDAADVSDVLFQTVNAGVINFEELAGGLGNVVGGAAAAKVSIDQVGSAIATMTLAGIGGAEAVTSLNALQTKLVQPSKALSAVYEKLGYESGAAALEQKGLRGVMEDLRKETGGNITTLLQLFPEIRAARGALALMANEGKNYTRTAKQIEDADARQGAAKRVLAEQMKAASNQLQLFKNKVDAAAISVGGELLPILIDGMDMASDFGSMLGDAGAALAEAFGPGLEDAGDILGDVWEILQGLLEVLGPLALAVAKVGVGALASAFNSLMAVVEPLTGFLADHEEVVIALATAYGISLAGGVAAAAAKLGWLAAFGLVKALDGLMLLQTRATTTGGALKAAFAGIAGGLGVGAVVAAAVVAWQSYNKAVDAVEDANKAVQRSFDKFDMSGVEDNIATLQGLVDKLDSRIADVGDVTSVTDALEDFFNVGANWEATGLLDADVRGALEDATNQLADARSAAMSLWSIMEDPPQREIEELSAAMSGLEGPEKQAEAFERLDAILTRFGPKAKKIGVDLSDGIGGVGNNELKLLADAYGGVSIETENAADAQQNIIDKLGGVEDAMGDAEKAADDLSDALDALMGAAMGVDEAGIKWRQGLTDLKKELAENGSELLGNSLAAGKNRLAVQDQVKSLQDLLVAQARNGAGGAQLTRTLMRNRDALIAAGDAAKIPRAEMEQLLNKYKLTPKLVRTLIKEYGGKDVKQMLRDLKDEADGVGKKRPKVDAKADTKKAEDDLERTGKKADELDRKKPEVTITARDAASRVIDGVRRFIDGLDGRTSTVYINTVRQNKVESMLQADGGYWPRGVFAMAQGGFLPQQAQIRPPAGAAGIVQWAERETGGEAFIPLSPTKRDRSEAILGQVAERFGYTLEQYADGGTRKEREEKAREAAAKARRRAATRKRRAALRSGSGGFELDETLMGTTSGYLSAIDEDKKVGFSLAAYTHALDRSNAAAQAWGKDMREVSRKTSADVVQSLRAMGEEGERIIKSMADSSKSDMRRVARQVRELQYREFASGLNQDVRAQSQFDSDLRKLISRGDTGLAAQLSELGWEAGGAVAAQAVRMSKADRRALARKMGRQDRLNDPLRAQALQLAGVLQGSAGDLGIIGLANASGMSIGDVVGLLERFRDVFGGLPAGKTRQIRADQRLIGRGEQPSGLAMGGIVTGDQASRGLFYRWAEPGSGGESLIPLGADRRGRALQLWEATGRMIGARATAGGGTIVVAPGAVQVRVDVSGANLTPADVERAATNAANSAMAGLARELKSGRRG